MFGYLTSQRLNWMHWQIQAFAQGDGVAILIERCPNAVVWRHWRRHSKTGS